MNLFEFMYPPFKFNQGSPIRLFEAFSGIGCQRMAFNRLGIPVESVGISEIDKYALKSYESIHGDCNNFGSITNIKGNQLPEIDVFTWSFPCTDLSKAGKQKGLVNTRSGLCYEVLRILHEAQNAKRLPQVLIMENVVDLIQAKFIRQFNEIQTELELLGYKNYVQALNAKDYGVPQNRDRVFMVSILGDYYYEFPKPIRLGKCLEDVLEEQVDEKYYLSDTAIKYITKGERLNKYTKIDGDISRCLTAKGSLNFTNQFVSECIQIGELTGEKWDKQYEKSRRVYSPDGISPTLLTCSGGGQHCKIIQTGHGYNKGGVKELAPSITSSSYDRNNVLCIPVLTPERIHKRQNGRRFKEDGDPMFTITTQDRHGIYDGCKIRRLTPLECWRLMGINDSYFWRAKNDGLSDSQLYKQAGNGIVVDVMAAIVRKLVV